jgi:Protein of unknown function (DUF3435)
MIRYDTMASYLGRAPRTDWIRDANSMCQRLDPRRPKTLSEWQLAEIHADPEIQKLASRKDELFRSIRDSHRFIYKAEGTEIHCEYQQARQAHHAAVQSRQRAALARVQKEYDAIAPLRDMQELVEGKEEPVERPGPTAEYLFPERGRLAEAFVNTKSFQADETAHRVRVIKDMITLCTRQSLVLRPRQRRPSPCSASDLSDEDAEEFAMEEDAEEQQLPIICEPTQCLECVSSSTLPVEERYKSYGSKDSLRRHYNRRHIFVPDRPCPHPACKQGSLTTRAHYMNHTATVHMIVMSEKTRWRVVQV